MKEMELEGTRGKLYRLRELSISESRRFRDSGISLVLIAFGAHRSSSLRIVRLHVWSYTLGFVRAASSHSQKN